MKTKTLNMTMPAELYDALKVQAAKKNISLAAFVRLICSERIENDGLQRTD